MCNTVPRLFGVGDQNGDFVLSKQVLYPLSYSPWVTFKMICPLSSSPNLSTWDHENRLLCPQSLPFPPQIPQAAADPVMESQCWAEGAWKSKQFARRKISYELALSPKRGPAHCSSGRGDIVISHHRDHPYPLCPNIHHPLSTSLSSDVIVSYTETAL